MGEASLGKFRVTHRNWQDDFRIASQVSNVAVQGHPLLNGPRLADGQGHSQDGVCTKFSWNERVQMRGFSQRFSRQPSGPHPDWDPEPSLSSQHPLPATNPETPPPGVDSSAFSPEKKALPLVYRILANNTNCPIYDKAEASLGVAHACAATRYRS